MACLDLVNAKGMTIQSNFVEIKIENLAKLNNCLN